METNSFGNQTISTKTKFRKTDVAKVAKQNKSFRDTVALKSKKSKGKRSIKSEQK